MGTYVEMAVGAVGVTKSRSAIAMFTTKCDIMSHHHFGATPKGGKWEEGGLKMVEMVMGDVGVTKCLTSLQLLCLLQSVTLCHTITLGASPKGENGGKGA